MANTKIKLVLFNVSQANIPRCISAKQTAIRVKTPPPYLQIGSLCLMRQTSIGKHPKNYGVVGVYRIIDVIKHDTTERIPGWEPQTGWKNVVNLEEILLLPSIFNEEFSIPTDVLRHKKSKYVKGLMNKDIQGASRVVDEPAATNYIQAIAERYPQLVELIKDRPLGLAPTDMLSKKFLNEEQEQSRRQARKITDQELAKKLLEQNQQANRQPIVSNGFVRNVYVGEFVRRRANGVCDLCKQKAPFADKDGQPFLEEHHIVWLSKGGRDTTDNAVALCPNCHRKMHVLGLVTDKANLLRLAKSG